MTKYQLFKETVWNYYSRNQRDLPWRRPEANGTFNPYKILISEVMLQQTQVRRVVPKFHDFLAVFPSFTALANASLADVLRVWNGLGYNRRAKFLWQTAQVVQNKYNGKLPRTINQLVALPGIGKNTAAAVLVYSFNEPQVFIETNIRSVFIYTFFHNKEKVTDKEILKLVIKMLDTKNPREWYWALMDYGAYLKVTVGNASRRSKHYVRQSTYEGSRRQLRARVLKVLLHGPCNVGQLQQQLTDDRLKSVLHDLTKEGFILQKENHYHLA